MGHYKKFSYIGLLAGLTIIALWFALTYYFLNIHEIETDSLTGITATLMGIGMLSFLYTGIFITAHDCMHASLAPGVSGMKGIHLFIGSLCTNLYAGLSYEKLCSAHWEHHRNPATSDDPDFHRGDEHFSMWYFAFMKQYVSWLQFGKMTVYLLTMLFLLKFSVLNVFIFWALPSILSSFQLFYFGTYLPHKSSELGHTNRHNSRTIPRTNLMSFLTCYHFGLHHEHHEFPHLQWWQLPGHRIPLSNRKPL